MLNKGEIIILVIFTILALVILVPYFWPSLYSNSSESAQENFTSNNARVENENKNMDKEENKIIGHVSPRDPEFMGEKIVRPLADMSDYESLVFDPVTQTIMTGSEFMDETGIITPPWIPPAWDPNALGPSSKGVIDPEDYENDPRMIYNKCSLGCCSPQYQLPFQGDTDPLVCGADGNSKYVPSEYMCYNNTGGIGCVCMTPEQADGLSNGFVGYKDDPENGY